MTDRDDDCGVPAPEGLELTMVEPGLALLSFPQPMPSVPGSLSSSEVELALAIYEGESNAAIARRRGIDTKRVSRQVEALYRKLGVGSRVQLVLKLRGAPR